jgi:hypothetical protein
MRKRAGLIKAECTERSLALLLLSSTCIKDGFLQCNASLAFCSLTTISPFSYITDPIMLLLRSLIAILPLVAPLVAGAALNKRQGPTLYLFGDSTMATCRYGPVYATESAGWGTTLASWLDISVINDARSGYSARQAHREKIYDAALATAQPGDMVVIQWGRNDGEHKPGLRFGRSIY